MSVTFTTDYGDAIEVDEAEIEVVESNPNYEVLQVRNNPGGVLTKVVYPNARQNVGGMQTSLPASIMDTDGIEAADIEQTLGVDVMEELGPIANPSAAGHALISWRNLRLSAAIRGARGASYIEGRVGQAVRKVSNIGAALGRINQNTSIRNFPELLLMATAEHWFDYIRNMDPVDVGAELSAEVTTQEQLAVYHFIKEWEGDPTHRGFRNRVNASAEIDSELAKGQIVYDIMTSRGPDPMNSSDYSKHRYDKMFRLAMDILSSIRLNTYNYYTINRLHVHEGDRVFMDFRSRYIPLSPGEVEMVDEMGNNITSGKSYAFQTTTNEQQALEADELMRKAVSSYQVGDTRTTRSILDVLRGSPYNYSPLTSKLAVAHAAEVDDTGKKVKVPRGELHRVTIKGAPSIPDEVKEGNMVFLSIQTKGAGNPVTSKGELDVAKKNKGAILVVHKSYFDTTPVGILKESNDKWIYDNYDAFMEAGKTIFEDKKQQSRSKKIHQAVRGNPKGRGTFLFLEIHPKAQLKMKRGSGEHKHGKSKSTAKWTKGLNKIFPGTQLVQVGTLKKTGEDAPYRIRLPVTHFKGVTHPTKGYRTIGIKKGTPQLKKVWQEIIDTYGMPKHAPSKGTYYRFKIDETLRGPYYDEVRRKVGKAKASR